jgi:hypothetical protein
MDSFIDRLDLITKKEYPNKVFKCTEDSDTAKRIKEAEVNIKLHGGIAFYCSKRHEYIYIK